MSETKIVDGNNALAMVVPVPAIENTMNGLAPKPNIQRRCHRHHDRVATTQLHGTWMCDECFEQKQGGGCSVCP